MQSPTFCSGVWEIWGNLRNQHTWSAMEKLSLGKTTIIIMVFPLLGMCTSQWHQYINHAWFLTSWTLVENILLLAYLWNQPIPESWWKGVYQFCLPTGSSEHHGWQKLLDIWPNPYHTLHKDLPHRPQPPGDSLSCITPVAPITMEFLCLFSEPSPSLLLWSLSWETGIPARGFETDSPIKDIGIWQKKRDPSVHPSVSCVVFLFGHGSISSVPLSKAHLQTEQPGPYSHSVLVTGMSVLITTPPPSVVSLSFLCIALYVMLTASLVAFLFM